MLSLNDTSRSTRSIEETLNSLRIDAQILGGAVESISFAWNVPHQHHPDLLSSQHFYLFPPPGMYWEVPTVMLECEAETTQAAARAAVLVPLLSFPYTDVQMLNSPGDRIVLEWSLPLRALQNRREDFETLQTIFFNSCCLLVVKQSRMPVNNKILQQFVFQWHSAFPSKLLNMPFSFSCFCCDCILNFCFLPTFN